MRRRALRLYVCNRDPKGGSPLNNKKKRICSASLSKCVDSATRRRMTWVLGLELLEFLSHMDNGKDIDGVTFFLINDAVGKNHQLSDIGVA